MVIDGMNTVIIDIMLYFYYGHNIVCTEHSDIHVL